MRVAWGPQTDYKIDTEEFERDSTNSHLLESVNMT